MNTILNPGQKVIFKGAELCISEIGIDCTGIRYYVDIPCEDCGGCPFYVDEVTREGEHDCAVMGTISFKEEDVGVTVFPVTDNTENSLPETDLSVRPIDANKITADSDIIKTILKLTRKCQFRYSSHCCLAPDCKECLARFFSPSYSHILPNINK